MSETSYDKIGSKLFKRLISLLLEHKHIALLGPGHGGKAIVLEYLGNQARQMPETNRPDVIRLVWSSFEGCYSEEEFAERLAAEFRVAPPVITCGGRLSGAILDMITAAVAGRPQPIWVFVQDVVKFSKPIARQMLEAFKSAHEDPDIREHLAVVVTGTEDFIPLTYGSDSPYRHAKQFLITGMDRESAEAFFCEHRARQRGTPGEIRGLAQEIEHDAFEYLYEQTGGSPHLIQELVGTAAHHPFDLQYTGLSPTWTRAETEEWIHTYVRVFMRYDYFSRMALRVAERLPRSFDILLNVLKSDPGQVTIPRRESPHPLEVGGLLVCDRQGLTSFSSPMVEQLVREALTDRYIADVYVCQGRWDEAWGQYERLPPDKRDRPVSGHAQFRLREVLLDWQGKLLDKAHEGVNSVVDHFLKGMRYLCGFDHGGLYSKEYMEWVAVMDGGGVTSADKPNHPPTPGYHETVESRDFWLDPARMRLWCDPNIHSRLPERPDSALLLVREKPGHEIDTADQQAIWNAVNEFWKAYEIAQQIEYGKRIGDLRDKQFRVLEDALRELVVEPFDMGCVVRKTAQGLVDLAGYYRILLCLVDAKRENIQAVASACREPERDFPNVTFRTSFPIPDPATDSALWDVQQLVVMSGVTEVIPDACAESQSMPSVQTEQARELEMKAITVVPLSTRGEVIGTVHFEREDREAPTNEEKELFEILGRQLAAVFSLAQRLTLLEGAVDRLDDHVKIVDPGKKVLFLNRIAAGDGDKGAGWQSDKTICVCERGVRESCFMVEAEQEGVARHYVRPESEEEKDWEGEGKAFDWQMARITDFRADLQAPFSANGVIGFVELIHDLTGVFDILNAVQDWLTAESVPQTADRILSLFERKGYAWCRLYLGDEEQTVLTSFKEFGLSRPENREAFARGDISYPSDGSYTGPWHVMKPGRGPAIYQHDPQLLPVQVMEAPALYGLPRYFTSDVRNVEALERQDVYQWIEAPLAIGDRTIGKMSFAVPGGLVGRWEIIKLVVQYAALALDHAIQRSRRQELETARRTAEMTARIEAWQDMSAQAAHIVGTPLYTIGSLLEVLGSILENQPEAQAIMEMLPRIRDKVEHARHFLQDFRVFATSSSLTLEQATIVDLLQASLCGNPSSDMETILDLDGQTPPFLCDADQIKVCFEELAKNAREAGAERLVVRARVQDRPKRIEVSFLDDGPGIRSGTEEKVFLPKYTTKAHGTGLGLPIVREVIERHKGTIAIEPGRSEGAHFVICLPILSRKELKENGKDQ